MKNSNWITWLTLVSTLLTTACGGGSSSGTAAETGAPVTNFDPDSEPEPSAPSGQLSFFEQGLISGLTLSHSFSDERVVTDTLRFSGGLTSGDYDRDGHLDIYWVAGDGNSNRLYRNLGDGRFEDVTAEAGLVIPGVTSSGPAFADLDGDGWLDLFVGAVAGGPIFVFQNNGDGAFTDVTKTSGLAFNAANTVSASFGDLNGSGYLDGVFTHWGKAVEAGVSPEILWINVSEGGQIRFEDRSLTWKLDQAYESHLGVRSGGGNRPDWSLTASLTDLERDGDLDILLVSDFGTTKVLRNDGGQLVNITNKQVITDSNGMGSALGDFDNDGDIDWFVTSISPSTGDTTGGPEGTANKLYRNEGDGQFTQIADSAGVPLGGWAWGACFADFNLDGLLDLFHVNGWNQPDPAFAEFAGDFSRLFMQAATGQFELRALETQLLDDRAGRGVVCQDFDRDGRIDIMVANNQQSPSYWVNQLDGRHGYLTVALEGEPPNTQAVGARVQLTTPEGAVQVREVRLSASYVATGAAEVYFGLDDSKGPVDISVIWPDGSETFFPDIPINQFKVLTKP